MSIYEQELNGDRYLDEDSLQILAEDMEMVPQLLLWEEFHDACMVCAMPLFRLVDTRRS